MAKDNLGKVKKGVQRNTVKEAALKPGVGPSAKADNVKAANTDVKSLFAKGKESESEDSLLKQVEEEIESRKHQEIHSTADSTVKQGQASSVPPLKGKQTKKTASSSQSKAKQVQVTVGTPQPKGGAKSNANLNKATAPTVQSKEKRQAIASTAQTKTNESKLTTPPVKREVKESQVIMATTQPKGNEIEVTVKADQSQCPVSTVDTKVNQTQSSVSHGQLVQNKTPAHILTTELKTNIGQASIPVVDNVRSIEKLGGFIFMCNAATKADCFKFGVFGLPQARKDIVYQIQPGMKLFLYDINAKLLHGVFIAISPGGLNLVPDAFKQANIRGFPAQVRFVVLEDCVPIPEKIFQNAIKDNYSDNNKFNIELTVAQTAELLKLFKPINIGAGMSITGVRPSLVGIGTSLTGPGAGTSMITADVGTSLIRGAASVTGGVGTSLKGAGGGTYLIGGAGTSKKGDSLGASLLGAGTSLTDAGTGMPLIGARTSLTGGSIGTSLIGAGIGASLAGAGISLTGFGRAGLGSLPVQIPAYNTDPLFYGRGGLYSLEETIPSQVNAPGSVPVYTGDPLASLDREQVQLQQARGLLKESLPLPVPYNADPSEYKRARDRASFIPGGIPKTSGNNIVPGAMGDPQSEYLHREMHHPWESVDTGMDTHYRERHNLYTDPLTLGAPSFGSQRRQTVETGHKRGVQEAFGIENTLATKRPYLQDDLGLMQLETPRAIDKKLLSKYYTNLK